MEFTRIILKPIHTEKTYSFANGESKKYAFEVDIKANKYAIAIAFESIYGIKPSKIATQIRKSAKVRTGTLKPGFSKLIKLAYVTLPIGSDIANNTNSEATKKVSTEVKPTATKETKKTEVTKKEVIKKAHTKKVSGEKQKNVHTQLDAKTIYEELLKVSSKSGEKKKIISKASTSSANDFIVELVAVNKDHTEFQTSKGEIIKTKDIIEEILTQTHLYVVGKQDNFLMVTKTDDGKKYLKAMPDDNLNNNLDSLKLIKEEK